MASTILQVQFLWRQVHFTVRFFICKYKDDLEICFSTGHIIVLMPVLCSAHLANDLHLSNVVLAVV